MTDLQEMKRSIVRTWRDMEMATFACDVVDAYARLWPCVHMVNDWDVWTESRSALRLEVALWIERNCDECDFYQPLPGLGLVGFKDPELARRFELRWSDQDKAMPDAAEDWNPHPLKSTFEADFPS